MRFEFWLSDEGTWQWQLISSLGDTLARGTPCASRELCLMAIKLVKLAAAATCIEVQKAPTVSASPFAAAAAPTA